jgi:hypothetical protein
LFVHAKDLFVAATMEKAPAIHDRGKLAEQGECSVRPFLLYIPL